MVGALCYSPVSTDWAVLDCLAEVATVVTKLDPAGHGTLAIKIIGAPTVPTPSRRKYIIGHCALAVRVDRFLRSRRIVGHHFFLQARLSGPFFGCWCDLYFRVLHGDRGLCSPVLPCAALHPDSIYFLPEVDPKIGISFCYRL